MAGAKQSATVTQWQDYRIISTDEVWERSLGYQSPLTLNASGVPIYRQELAGWAPKIGKDVDE